jgi:hypothetical protein
MYAFAIAAIGMAIILVVAGAQRPRLAIFVAAILWLLYAVYEYHIANGTLCSADCNIRVDLVFFLPILALATFCAYQSYNGRPGQAKIIGIVLGVIGLLVVGSWAEGHGYGTPAHIAIVLVALAFGVYHFKSRAKSSTPSPD